MFIRKIKLFIYLIITLGLSLAYFSYEKDLRIDELSHRIKAEHHHQLDSAILDFQNETEIIFYNIINTESILKLQQKALLAKNENERNHYRKELFQKLSPLYKHLKTFGLKQLHFHFPDATSFLRFHKPNRFGDNLTTIRPSLVAVNRTLEPISGFEEGRIYNGYRFVYPLIYKKKHIGSVEVSIGFNAINDRSQMIYKTYQYMILNKNVVEDKVFNGEKKNYEVSMINANFYHEANAFVNKEKIFADGSGSISLKLFSKINTHLKKRGLFKKLNKYEDFIEYIKIDEKYYQISFHPIENILKQEIGYIISYKKSLEYRAILKEYYIKVQFIILIIILLFFFLYKMQKDKDKLHEYSKKALEASRSKSEFLANMSHEIRTPLNAILGFVQILQKETKNRKSIQYVNIIYEASHSLLQIIEDILDFSKIESGKLEIDNIDFNTRKEFEVITHLFEAKCSQKDINLTLKLEDNIPRYIHADPLRIKQVLSNLLSNAIKFTENGKNITVTLKYFDSKLHVSVLDQGVGIPQDKQAHIFEAFAQEDSSTTRKHGGTGLGLSISSELINLMGGELKLKSTLGVGSEFYFSVPVLIGNTIEEEQKQHEDVKLEGTVLLVEDNKTNQQFMKIILGDLELDVETADDGLKAIEKFKNTKYDIILMDENMPDMGGVEATKEILKIEKENKLVHTPIIALTANALKGDKEKFLNAGMDEYISKPVDTQLLAEILTKLLVK